MLFSDGVTESMNVKGQELKLDGVKRVIRTAGNVAPTQIGERLAEAVRQHATGRDPHDDVTVVVVGRRS